MAVENPGLIADLNPAWPQDTDEAREGAEHVRVTKTSLQIQFPGLRNAASGGVPVAATDEELNHVQGVTGPVQDQLDALAQAISDLDLDPFELGDYKVRAAATDPSPNWLLCDGAAVDRTTYSGLFAVIGETFGSGDGSSTFNLPDYRGRVHVDAGSGVGLTARVLGETGGEEAHLLTGAESGMPSHRHDMGSNPSGSSGGNTDAPVGGSQENGTGQTKLSGALSASQAHNNMQPFLVGGHVFIKALPNPSP